MAAKSRKKKFTKVIIGDATLYHGDCLDALGDVGKVDIVLTSPPYNTLQQQGHKNPSGVFKNNNWLKRAATNYSDEMPEGAYQRYLRDRLDACFAKVRGLMWINHKVRYRNKVGIHPLRMLPYPLHQEIIWDRASSMVLNGQRFAGSHEGVWAFGRPHYWNRVNDAVLRSVWRIRSVGDDLHPCIFPDALIQPIIVASCPERGIVLDPFAGTGRAGIVAIKNGRRCILIEKEKKNFNRIVRDIKALYTK